MPELEQPLSIGDAFQQGLEKIPANDKPDESGTDSGDGNETPAPKQGENDDGDPAPEDDKKPDDAEGDKKPEAKEGEGQEKENSKSPLIDPKTGKYVGEYNKERFDGLMSAWQKDQAAAAALTQQVETLTKAVAELRTQAPKKDEKADGKEDDFEVPPEFAHLEEGEKAGFKLLMKHASNLTKNMVEGQKQAIMKEVMETINAPARERVERDSRALKEVELLTAEFGSDFKDNLKEVIAFHEANGLAFGQLRQAYTLYKQFQTMKQGKEVIKKADEEREKDGGSPDVGKARKGATPTFDPARDGSMSISDGLQYAYRQSLL